jgi:hypothetical protein
VKTRTMEKKGVKNEESALSDKKGNWMEEGEYL